MDMDKSTEIKLASAGRPDRRSLNALQTQPAHTDQRSPGRARVEPRETENMRTRLLTLREVAQYLQVHPGTVYRLVKAGQLRAARVGRDLRFDIRELDDWVSKGGTASSKPVTRKK
jgi:excisionase family DNA binding protein